MLSILLQEEPNCERVLCWSGDVSAGDVLTLLGLLAAAISLYLAGRQLARTEDQIKKAALATRAQSLFAMHSLYFSEEEERRFFYKLDWGTWRFDPKRFAKSKEEPWLDNILYKLDVLGRMVKIGALSHDDAGLLAFQAKRVLGNPQVEAYLKWLAQDYRNEDPNLVPHADAKYLASLASDQFPEHTDS